MATRREELTIRANNLFDLARDNTGRLHFRESTFSSVAPYDHNENGSGDILKEARQKFVEANRRHDPAAYANFVSTVRSEVARQRRMLINIQKNSQNLTNISQTARKPNVPFDGRRTSKYTESSAYDRTFERVEGFPGDTPNEIIVRDSAQKGFNLGQITGPDFGNPQAQLRRSVFSQFDSIVRGIETGRNSFLDFVNFLSDPKNQEALAKKFDPKYIRPQNPNPNRTSLESKLRQNLLLEGTGTDTDTFEQLYTRNRGADNNFSEGLIGGVPVRDIQEPDNNGTKLFSFEDDRANFMQDKQDRGFNHNINRNSEKLNPAVVNIERPSESADVERELAETFGLSDAQFFPFMFETENKQNAKQYAFFQAALQSVQEAYQPSWSAKSFVGRTEKVHTYLETERTLDISFVIFATQGRQLQNIYERINWLAQQTYGEQENNNGVITRTKSGPLLRLTIGDIFSRVPGFIRNLSFNWDFAGPGGGKWEMTKGLRMPQMCQVQTSFMVIHQALPDRDFNFYWGLEAGMHKNGKLIPTRTPTGGETQGNRIVKDYVDRLRDLG